MLSPEIDHSTRGFEFDEATLAAIAVEMKAVRRRIHQHPELAFHEHKTAALVADCLRQWGYTVTEGVGGTGVVATLRQGNSARALGIRADMDALPITEQTGLAYASTQAGVMHACGHDGHTAMLLGAARYLSAHRSFNGTLNLIFQPAEEKGFDSGAVAMLRDGVLERFPCDVIYAIHNLPGAPSGGLMFREGGYLAAGDRVFVKVRGKGGHAARPHQCVDPVVAASAIVMSLQAIASRFVNPEEAVVVTVSRFIGGNALNVIPESVDLGLSVRTFSDTVRRTVQERVTRIIQSTAEAYGATVEIDYINGYPVVNNDAAATQFAATVATAVFGADRVTINHQRSMGSEDFAYFLEKLPGSMIRLGNDSSTCSAALHTPHYDFNDDNIEVGIRFWSALAQTYLL